MKNSFKGIFSTWASGNYVGHILLLIICSVLTFITIIFPFSLYPSSLLKVGDVANQDIRAPRNLSFTSQILTEQARAEAEIQIQPVYLPADPNIARQQLEKLRIDLNYVSSVRSDSFASTDQKLADMAAIQDVRVSQNTAGQILLLDASQWATIQQETLRSLEQIMRLTIREDRLVEAQRNVPTLISFSLPEDQFQIVSEIVKGFVVPNSLYSEELTLEAKKQAGESVKPVMQTFVEGETIVNRGDIITEVIWETLNEFELIQPLNNPQKMVADIFLVVFTNLFVVLYFFRKKVRAIYNLKNLAVILINYLLFLTLIRLAILNQENLVYIFPLPAFGLTISFLFGMEAGMIFSIALSVLAAFGVTDSLQLTIFYIFSSLCGILVLGKGRRIANFFWAGLSIGLMGSLVIAAYKGIPSSSDWLFFASLITAAFINGIASASLTLLLQFLYSHLLGLTTPLRLIDLSRPDHPLLQFLLLNAPGTYQHSLQVANLAEQAIKALDGDALLVRVGALYHDVGKASNPSFYIENQLPGFTNPHDLLEPESSARIIIQHVQDGVNMAKKYHIPKRIQDFIVEHHGTLLTMYQYNRAIQQANNDVQSVEKEKFRYPGPAPKSRETAILMIADGVEARFRANPPQNEEELRKLIFKTIDFLNREKQLDATNLTYKDLNLITEIFVRTLLNTRHLRIQYPEVPKPSSEESSSETDNLNAENKAELTKIL